MRTDPKFPNLQILETGDDVTPEIEAKVKECYEAYFSDAPDEPMGTMEFFDRLEGFLSERDYATDEWSGYEIDDVDTPAARKIMRIARALRKEQKEWG
jgi:hypothetical protein